jgi:DNA polymerase-3 subunit gamma/tau
VVLETVVLRMASAPSTTSLKEILDKLAHLQEKLTERTGTSESAVLEPPFASPKPEKKEQHGGDSSKLTAPTGLKDREKVPPASAGVEELPAEKSWSALTEGIRKEKPLLASLLDHSRLVKKEGNCLDIGFLGNSLFSESVQEPAKKRELEQVCEEFFGEKMRINVCFLDSGEEEREGQKSRLSTSQRNEKIREEAKRHPLVREALNIFGGGITEIKVITPTQTK